MGACDYALVQREPGTRAGFRGCWYVEGSATSGGPRWFRNGLALVGCVLLLVRGPARPMLHHLPEAVTFL